MGCKQHGGYGQNDGWDEYAMHWDSSKGRDIVCQTGPSIFMFERPESAWIRLLEVEFSHLLNAETFLFPDRAVEEFRPGRTKGL